jgi:thymidylate synthase (FAD)
MGSDLTVVNSARVSFDKESDWEVNHSVRTELSEKDGALIRYLAKHNHFTPFTHCMVTLRETVPIFVARQRFKHTIGFSYNEVSRIQS